jgi:hypothetical protein
MDVTNILSNSVPAQAAGATATTASEVINAPVQQPSAATAVAVPQGQVQTDLPQTSQDTAGPTFQLKIIIDQTIVQFLSKLDQLFAEPQAVADFLPESIRQDLQQILSNQLLAATPETFVQGVTAVMKTNKDTADAFSQLAKGVNVALTFQDKLPDSAQKFLLSARPLLTELLIQIKSELNPQTAQQVQLVNTDQGSGQQPLTGQTTVSTASQDSVIPQQGMPISQRADASLPQSSQVGTAIDSAIAEPATVIATQPGVTQPVNAVAPEISQQGMPISQRAEASSPQSSQVETAPSAAIAEPATVIAMQRGVMQPNTVANAIIPQGTTSQAFNTSPQLLSQAETAQGSALTSKAPSFVVNQLSEVSANEIKGPAVKQLATDSVIRPEQAQHAVNNQQINDKQMLIKALTAQNNGVATEPAASKSDSQMIAQATVQAVISNILMMNNNPPVPTGPVGVDDFFNWIAQQFRLSQDDSDLQKNLQQKVDIWSKPLSQLSEQDSKAFNEIKQQLEQQLPSQLKQMAIKLPALKDLYVYNKMSDLAKFADLSQNQLSAAKDSISRLAESFQKSLVDSLSFHSETGSSGKIFTFFMPLAFDGTTMFPAHIHIYHQKQPEKRGGPLVAETWLRIFLKTDYSGTVTVLFHVRQQAVDMKLGFSDKQAAQDFYAWLPDIRQSLANSPFTLQDIQVLSA